MANTFCPVCQASLTLNQDPCPYCGAAQGLARVSPCVTWQWAVTLHQSKFTVRRVLGEEGFGITYKGAHRDLWQPVAITELFSLVYSYATFVM